MQAKSDRKTRLLRALSDPIIFAIIELLGELDFSNGFWLREILLKIRDKKGLECEPENLYKKLQILEDFDLLRHGAGLRGKWQQERWFPVPREVYTSILQKIDEIQSLANVGSNITNLTSLYPDIKIRSKDDRKRPHLLSRFKESLKALLEPANFKLMSPSLIWRIYKMATDPDVDVDFSDII